MVKNCFVKVVLDYVIILRNIEIVDGNNIFFKSLGVFLKCTLNKRYFLQNCGHKSIFAKVLGLLKSMDCGHSFC